MNKFILIAVLSFTAIMSFSFAPTLEARHYHRHSRVQVGLGIGNVYAPAQTTIVRRYAAPVAVPVVPVATPYYYAPEYMYAAPAYPGYIEEVYTVPQRPVGLSGLSFSWNFFR